MGLRQGESKIGTDPLLAIDLVCEDPSQRVSFNRHNLLSGTIHRLFDLTGARLKFRHRAGAPKSA